MARFGCCELTESQKIRGRTAGIVTPLASGQSDRLEVNLGDDRGVLGVAAHGSAYPLGSVRDDTHDLLGAARADPSARDDRADFRAASRHTRWVDELRLPLEDRDSDRAEALCGQVTRAALRDLAPALVLLSHQERRRAQALGAYALLLFDFARQTGLQGERLAQINRLEFELDRALEGEPAGQPIFVALARQHEIEAWPRQALDDLAAAARARALNARPATDAEALQVARELGGALAEALTGSTDGNLSDLAAGVLRLAALLDLGDLLRRHQVRLSRETLPEEEPSRARGAERIVEAVLRECTEIEVLLDIEVHPGPGLSRSQRRSAICLQRLARRLLARSRGLGARLLERRPRVGAWERVVLVARSRWAG